MSDNSDNQEFETRLEPPVFEPPVGPRRAVATELPEDDNLRFDDIPSNLTVDPNRDSRLSQFPFLSEKANIFLRDELGDIVQNPGETEEHNEVTVRYLELTRSDSAKKYQNPFSLQETFGTPTVASLLRATAIAREKAIRISSPEHQLRVKERLLAEAQERTLREEQEIELYVDEILPSRIGRTDRKLRKAAQLRKESLKYIVSSSESKPSALWTRKQAAIRDAIAQHYADTDPTFRIEKFEKESGTKIDFGIEIAWGDEPEKPSIIKRVVKLFSRQ